ncbi:MAG: 23S rRNA (uracil(1939)-C(5))-methyltransferase RlmD [Clostridia bacterium]|nr:23S rRNA (uracil(1939)-C(5))-methyltransferase RlmD [Clostridia bacterium]
MEKKIVDFFDISYEGAGVGKLDGQIIFVPKVLIGEKAEVLIVKKKSNFLLGRVENVLKPSEERTESFCPYYGICGGCDFQHCDYSHEIFLKKQILTKELKKVGFDGKIDVVLSDKRKNYRNKLKLEVKDNKIGYFRQKSHSFFEIKGCPIASEKINSVIPTIKQFLTSNNLKGLNNVYIKHVGDLLGICFLFGKNVVKNTQKLKKLEIFGENSVYFAYGDVLESNKTKIFCVYGKPKLTQKLDGFDIEIDVSSFNQINDDVAEKLYDYVTEKTVNKRVVNAYSGQGFLTYLISQKAKFVFGIEYQYSSHESAEKLKDLSEEYKFENVCGRVEDCLSTVLLRDKIDLIVLDPAREGCQKTVLDAILSSGINQIVYVSCNFATLVRDVKILQEKYAVENVRMFDMFPCTANMETVVTLSKI